MIHNIFWLAVVAIVAFLITCVVSKARKRGEFSQWWDAEGFAWFVIIGIALYIAGCAVGIFQFRAWN